MSNKAKLNGWEIFGLTFAGAVLVLVVTLTAVLFWRWELLEGAPKVDAGAKLIAAVLALMGGAMTSAVTMIGLILRRQNEAERTRLENEGEKRRSMQAVIEAVGLLGTPTGMMPRPRSGRARYSRWPTWER